MQILSRPQALNEVRRRSIIDDVVEMTASKFVAQCCAGHSQPLSVLSFETAASDVADQLEIQKGKAFER